MNFGCPNAIFTLAQGVLLFAGIICSLRNRRFIKGSQAESLGNLIANVLTIAALVFLVYSSTPFLVDQLGRFTTVTLTESFFKVFCPHYIVFWLFFIVVCLSLFVLRRQEANSNISKMELCGTVLIAISALIPLLLDPQPEPTTYKFIQVRPGQDDSLP